MYPESTFFLRALDIIYIISPQAIKPLCKCEYEGEKNPLRREKNKTRR